jgi:glutamine synthetase
MHSIKFQRRGHQSIWKGGQPVFAGYTYADLSEMCLFYIGGILPAGSAEWQRA